MYLFPLDHIEEHLANVEGQLLMLQGEVPKMGMPSSCRVDWTSSVKMKHFAVVLWSCWADQVVNAEGQLLMLQGEVSKKGMPSSYRVDWTASEEE